MRAGLDEARVKWRELVSEQSRSGQSVAVYCRERGLRLWQFYEWKKRLRDSDSPKFVEVAVKPPAEIVQQPRRHGSAIEVRLRSGHSLVVERGFDANHLRALLAVFDAPTSKGRLPWTALDGEA
jgi:hypothetical protein